MTWKSHIAIATAVTLPFNPIAIPVAVLGSTAPDWSEWILKFFGIRVQHRGATHYLYIPLLIIAFSFIFDYRNLIFWFGVGYLTHWITDSFTISGVPLSQFDKHRIHLFGGKLRTGQATEYLIAYSLLGVSILLSGSMANFNFIKSNEAIEFRKFNTDFGDLHEKKIIDNKEMLEKRFQFF